MNRFQQILLFLSVLLLVVVIILYQRNIEQQREVAILQNAREDASLCPLTYEPVCGVDGNTYANRCFAETKSQVAVASVGECSSVSSSASGDMLSGTVRTDTESGILDLYRVPESVTGSVSGATDASGATSTGVETATGFDLSAMTIGSVSETSLTGETATSAILPVSSDAIISTGASTASGEERTTTYYNMSHQYGFDVPATMYYRGFGSQDRAIHSVGIFSSSGSSDSGTFATANVRVFLYRSLPDIVANAPIGTPIMSADGKRILVRLSDTYSAGVESDAEHRDTAQEIARSLVKK